MLWQLFEFCYTIAILIDDILSTRPFPEDLFGENGHRSIQITLLVLAVLSLCLGLVGFLPYTSLHAIPSTTIPLVEAVDEPYTDEGPVGDSSDEPLAAAFKHQEDSRKVNGIQSKDDNIPLTTMMWEDPDVDLASQSSDVHEALILYSLLLKNSDGKALHSEFGTSENLARPLYEPDKCGSFRDGNTLVEGIASSSRDHSSADTYLTVPTGHSKYRSESNGKKNDDMGILEAIEDLLADYSIRQSGSDREEPSTTDHTPYTSDLEDFAEFQPQAEHLWCEELIMLRQIYLSILYLVFTAILSISSAKLQIIRPSRLAIRTCVPSD
ncbi:MAG: hypothetical protein M1839_004608 [Geoglossum umbratile]|nr:MAG: hypothetical protein M1839_004608 [Geoglossum umbratile]